VNRKLIVSVAMLAIGGTMLTSWPGDAAVAQSNPDDDPADPADDPDDDVDVPDPDDGDTPDTPDAPDTPDTPDSPGDTPDAGGDTPDADSDTPDPGSDTPDGGDTPDGDADTPDADGGAPGGDGDASDGETDGGSGGAAGDDGEGETDADDDAGPASPAGDDDGDDDAAPAGGGAGGDDDDGPDDDDAPTTAAAGSNDDDDDDAPAVPAGTAGGDDDDGPGGDDGGELPSGSGNNGGDDDDDVLNIIGGGDETEAERIRLDDIDNIESDREGYRYRKNEFVALDLDAAELTKLRGDGFEVIRSERLAALQGTVYLLRGPAGRSDDDTLTALEGAVDPGTLSLNHLFDSSSARVRTGKKAAPVTRTACGCRVGLIDTGVAANLGMFKHVQVEQRAFNATAAAPRLHGTAVAHLFAGSTPMPGQRTRILVADVFAGPRETSGSTFALVKALDWMAAQGVPVINVSLAGPRNPVVARTVEKLVGKGHIVVAAAGNDGPAAPPVFPGAYSGVVAVTAVDNSRQVYRYANRGAYVDFAARGVNVASIDPRGATTSATGTSFAAPIVAARLAKLLTRPDVKLAQSALSSLESQARDLGTPGRDGIFGHGLIEDAP
jgi:Subtilase family